MTIGLTQKQLMFIFCQRYQYWRDVFEAGLEGAVSNQVSSIRQCVHATI